MKTMESSLAFEEYRSAQVAWASAEDLLLILAKELVRLKEETGMNLFWDENEEQYLREVIENTETGTQN